jgi:hypothetical protein
MEIPKWKEIEMILMCSIVLKNEKQKNAPLSEPFENLTDTLKHTHIYFLA